MIPVYNVEQYLRRCVESVQKQTYRNMEIILVDDGSTDASGELCDAFSQGDSRIHVLHKRNGGLSDARNAGIDVATGKYITFIDSDDWVSLDFVEILYRNLIRYGAEVSGCAFRRVSGDAAQEDERKSERVAVWDSREALRKMLRQEDGFTTSACALLYDMECFQSVRYPYGKLFEDLGTTYKILGSIRKMVRSDLHMYYYYTRPGSIANQSFRPEYMDEYRFALDVVEYVERHYLALRRDAENRLVGVCFHIYMSMSREQTRQYRQECQTLLSEIRRRRRTAILGRDTPAKVRLGCLASLFGMGFARFVYRLLRVKGK